MSIYIYLYIYSYIYIYIHITITICVAPSCEWQRGIHGCVAQVAPHTRAAYMIHEHDRGENAYCHYLLPGLSSWLLSFSHYEYLSRVAPGAPARVRPTSLPRILSTEISQGLGFRGLPSFRASSLLKDKAFDKRLGRTAIGLSREGGCGLQHSTVCRLATNWRLMG